MEAGLLAASCSAIEAWTFSGGVETTVSRWLVEAENLLGRLEQPW